MKLTKAKVTEFKSVRDSGEFEIGDITCLVGKNEAGKTALLQALYRLNPIVEGDNKFDVTDDYPRSEVEDYQQDVEENERDPADVIQATFTLDDVDLKPIQEMFGEKVISNPRMSLSRGYSNMTHFGLATNEQEAFRSLFAGAQLTPDVAAALTTSSGVDAATEILNAAEQTEDVTRLTKILTQVKERGLNGYIYDKYLSNQVPKFFYFDEYYQMKGFENIEALMQRQAANTPQPSDHPMVGLIDLARLKLSELLNPQRTQELVNKLEAAGNHLGKKVLKYWSQNRHLQTRFDVRPARPGDPAGMTSGNNVWAGVYDARHMVTTNLGTRSRGFVWFFSFLAWYSQVQKKNEPLILLLDEPGLSLHGKAQEDLLRYFEEELKDHHQVVYSTHSPFMVDPQHFDRVRIVQDKGIDAKEPLPPEEDGTKVLTDVLEATGDSLFPLQGALGYEIYQTLFIGPNSLIVEGVTDLLYLQVISSVLERAGQEGLSQKWTITPVGGSDKVPTFVALIGAQRGLKIATLIDIQKKDQQTVDNLFKKKLLKKNHVLTFAEFTGTAEADIEDMFDHDFFLRLVNEEFDSDLQKSIKPADLNNNIPRINVRLVEYFKAKPMKKGGYGHFRSARYLSENIATLEKDISAATLDRFESAFKKLNALL